METKTYIITNYCMRITTENIPLEVAEDIAQLYSTKTSVTVYVLEFNKDDDNEWGEHSRWLNGEIIEEF